MSTIGKYFHQVYRFEVVADLSPPPKKGQIAIVTETPDYGSACIQLVTDGIRTIRQLYNDWRAMQDVEAEMEARKEADDILQENIDAEAAALSSHAAQTAPHSATPTPAGSRIAMYDANKRLKSGAAPSAADDVVRKTELDAEAAALATHAANTAPHSATPTPAADRIAMYDADKRLKSGAAPSAAADVVRKTELDAEAAARTQADDTLQEDKIDKDVAGQPGTLMQSIEFSEVTSNGATITMWSRGVDTPGDAVSTDVEMPVASEEQAGIMPAESYSQIAENTTRIAALEGRALHYPVTLSSSTPSQTDLQDAYEEASGETGEAPDQVTLDDTAFGKSYTWYTASGLWKDRGSSTVTQFTNSSAGIIQGNNADGKVFAEENGTGSVVGWDALKTRTSNLESSVSNLESGKAPINAALTDEPESGALPAAGSTPVTSLLQTIRNCLKYLSNQKAPLASPVFTGTPKVPSKTSAAVNDGTLIATEAQVYAARGDFSKWFFIGKTVTQYPDEPTPVEAGYPGNWENWSSRAVLYGVSSSALPSYSSYSSLAGSSVSAGSMPYALYSEPGGDSRLYRLIEQTAAYTVPSDFDPVKWVRYSSGVTVVERQKAGNALTANDYTIGTRITSGTYANRYVAEIIVPGGKFLGVAGGNRPAFVSGGVQADRARRIKGEEVNYCGQHADANFTGALYRISGQTSYHETGGGAGGPLIGLDSGLVVPTGPDNAPANLSVRIWRRVS
jgi:hypothetical protein